MNEYYGVPSTPTEDFLAHYGIKGMRWGVRKAIIKGDQKSFDKHFKKAAKKLAKLQDRALYSGKYAAKAAGYGAAAAGVGTLAVGGTGLTSKGIKAVGKVMQGNKHRLVSKIGKKINDAGEAVNMWGKYDVTKKEVLNRVTGKKEKIKTYSNPKGMSNNNKFRIGAGVAALGLGAASARNAYIAANGRKYMDKAEAFKRAMDDSFSGTKYQGQYNAPLKQRKRRRG